ncbi:GNAT family N-acetyltransferase [Dinoroseobacter sp. S375]|uniref:GNAT family N-acetyltransferase n=1 Tax=Dinoroseobacter sp. S375 TaxID=3415136 RepID=UPI003C7E4EF5
MSGAVISKELNGSKGRYVLRRDGEEAEVTFSVASPQTIIADHTGVPEALRGTGAGHALVAFMVEDVRAQGIKIVPLCPFVNAERRKHPDWADAFQV